MNVQRTKRDEKILRITKVPKMKLNHIRLQFVGEAGEVIEDIFTRADLEDVPQELDSLSDAEIREYWEFAIRECENIMLHSLEKLRKKHLSEEKKEAKDG